MSDSELLNEIYSDVQGIKKQVTDLQLTLENETNRNIKIIAEGHLDLSRKLDEALKVENEKEMLLIRVNTLENELRRITQWHGMTVRCSTTSTRLGYADVHMKIQE